MLVSEYNSIILFDDATAPSVPLRKCSFVYCHIHATYLFQITKCARKSVGFILIPDLK